EVVRRRGTRADLAPGVAADAAVAAGEEAQAGRHRHQFAGPGGAGLAAHDQAVGHAERAVPGAAAVQLDEAGVRAHVLHATAHGQGAAEATAREQAVVHVDVGGAQFRVDQGGIGVQARAGGRVHVVAPALAQRVERGHRGPALADLAAAAGHQLHVAQVDVVGLLVVEADREAVPAVQPGERGDPVLGEEALALLRPVQVPVELVPAVVDVAPLHAQAHAGAAFGAVREAGGVDVALGHHQVDVHRYAQVVAGFLRLGLDVDRAEVVQPHQRLAQAVELALVVVAAFLPGHQLLQQAGPEVVLVEGGRAHVV